MSQSKRLKVEKNYPRGQRMNAKTRRKVRKLKAKVAVATVESCQRIAAEMPAARLKSKRIVERERVARITAAAEVRKRREAEAAARKAG